MPRTTRSGLPLHSIGTDEVHAHGDAFLVAMRSPTTRPRMPLMTLDEDSNAEHETASVALPLKRRGESAHEVIRIGRDEGNDVVVHDNTVSKFHAELRVSGGKFFLRDVGSRNGTLVDGRPAREWTEVASGNAVWLGKLSTVFVDGKRLVDMVSRMRRDTSR